ncbi:hypothetical protein SAMN02982929_03572 [Saccharopolyspora kobensis]|uniref:Uncharacterized protein n=1 Tax=Saccharopolyspora kobensis TaxID=146035 RepID=A0A1H6CVC4_9PSEU|nr:hypothetical protein SAMN02982929_03572 [Saccharopolyspora kobensis]SFD00377.1 hypothetical protein SAMN05216506_102166 [Saccharopolyspora kobensis]
MARIAPKTRPARPKSEQGQSSGWRCSCAAGSSLTPAAFCPNGVPLRSGWATIAAVATTSRRRNTGSALEKHSNGLGARHQFTVRSDALNIAEAAVRTRPRGRNHRTRHRRGFWGKWWRSTENIRSIVRTPLAKSASAATARARSTVGSERSAWPEEEHQKICASSSRMPTSAGGRSAPSRLRRSGRNRKPLCRTNGRPSTQPAPTSSENSTTKNSVPSGRASPKRARTGRPPREAAPYPTLP